MLEEPEAAMPVIMTTTITTTITNMTIPWVVCHCQQPHLRLVANVKVKAKKST
jgi:hypothetical protein